MIDHRMETFLNLCDLMNYRQVAEALCMTQPAVTQHIQFLEGEYGCKLFEYSGRQLRKTEAGKKLEVYARSARSNETAIRNALLPQERRSVRIGATKTIGDYVIGERMGNLVARDDLSVTLTVDNTHNLLYALNHQQLDIALIEGYFDQSDYDSHPMGREELVGICAKDSPLTGTCVSLKEIFGELLILREEGSGTRAVFEGLLREQNYSLDAFAHTACISSFEVIKTLVRTGRGIAFVYESVAESDPELATFTLAEGDMWHDFSYVYLKDTPGEELIALIGGDETSVSLRLTAPFPKEPFDSAHND